MAEIGPAGDRTVSKCDFVVALSVSAPRLFRERFSGAVVAAIKRVDRRGTLTDLRKKESRP